MILNWQEKLSKESNSVLFELFSETDRLNIEPQIYAGNLLYQRGFDPEKLRAAKARLINSIENEFLKKYSTDPNQIKRENTFREVIIRTLIALVLFFLIYHLIEFEFWGIDNKTLAYLIAALNLSPLLYLKNMNERAIQYVQKQLEKKNQLINKINTELLF